ncbi:AAEL006119-PA [Aedes aegypti]|uniref:AAEL006119-PA n=1 Tax=Aedes aegypti TaxID=7159 RepID=Q177J4_AEDAE|nr:AAEL006119-PA [Aedes aegypti]
MASSHVSPQVCRPHFHGPLSWLSDPAKPIASGSGAWGSPFACPQDPQDKLGHAGLGLSSGQGNISQAIGASGSSSSGIASSSQHLFSFPPTPPKDSTPDSIQTAPTEYQATINAFMHQAQVTSNSIAQQAAAAAAHDSCMLDVKPCLTGGSLGLNGSSAGGSGSGGSGNSGGQNQQSKQREGTTLNSAMNGGSSSGSGSSSAGNHSLFDTGSYGAGGYADTVGSNGGGYGGGGGGGGGGSSYHHQQSGSFQPNPRSSGMPGGHHLKSQRTKARTSAV